MEINISQTQADLLISMEKHDADPSQIWAYPSLGGSISIPLTSADNREKFLLDIYKARIDLLKGTFQNRAGNVIILVRLDFGGRPHRNPDGQEIACPHFHRYREGYGDKWAEALPPALIEFVDQPRSLLERFMEYCRITKKPNIDWELFS